MGGSQSQALERRMIRINFHPEAEEELLAAKRWYRERSRLAARAFDTEISQAIRQIAASPNRYPETPANERRFVLSTFPFQFFIASEKTKF